MGFSELKKEVLRKAEREAQRIVNEAEKTRDDIKKDVKRENKEAEDRAMEEISRIQDMIQKKESASARLEAKRLQLKAKKDMVDDVFKKAVAKLNQKLTKTERKAIIERLVKRAKEEIDIAKIYCNKKDSGFIDKYAVGETEMLGGIIAEDTTGLITVDYSFESMIDEIKNTELSKITKILFK